MKLTIAALAMCVALTSTAAFAGVVVHEKPAASDHSEQMGIVVHENNANGQLPAVQGNASGQLPAVQNQQGQIRASINFARDVR
jgi:hypothetical protein